MFILPGGQTWLPEAEPQRPTCPLDLERTQILEGLKVYPVLFEYFPLEFARLSFSQLAAVAGQRACGADLEGLRSRPPGSKGRRIRTGTTSRRAAR